MDATERKEFSIHNLNTAIENLKKQAELSADLFTVVELDAIGWDIGTIAFKLWERRGLPLPPKQRILAKEAAADARMAESEAWETEKRQMCEGH